MTSQGCGAAELRRWDADFHDAQLENQKSDGFRIGSIPSVKNSSIDGESFNSGLNYPLMLELVSVVEWCIKKEKQHLYVSKMISIVTLLAKNVPPQLLNASWSLTYTIGIQR